MSVFPSSMVVPRALSSCATIESGGVVQLISSPATHDDEEQSNDEEPIGVPVHFKADAPIPLSDGIFYFEASLVSSPASAAGGIGLVVGISTVSLRTNHLPGEERHSYGFFCAQNTVYCGGRASETYAVRCGEVGDTIGCIVDFLQNTLSWVVNGKCFGPVVAGFFIKQRPQSRPMHGEADDRPCTFYPVVGVQALTPGARIRVSFPNSIPIQHMAFDIGAYREKVISTLMSQNPSKAGSSDPSASSGDSIRVTDLIQRYLIRRGFHRTLQALRQAHPTAEANSEEEPELFLCQVVDSARHRLFVDRNLEGLISLVSTLVDKQLFTYRLDLFVQCQVQRVLEAMTCIFDANCIAQAAPSAAEVLNMITDCAASCLLQHSISVQFEGQLGANEPIRVAAVNLVSPHRIRKMFATLAAMLLGDPSAFFEPGDFDCNVTHAFRHALWSKLSRAMTQSKLALTPRPDIELVLHQAELCSRFNQEASCVTEQFKMVIKSPEIQAIIGSRFAQSGHVARPEMRCEYLHKLWRWLTKEPVECLQ